MQSQNAVTAYFSSKQLLPFGFAERCCNNCGLSMRQLRHDKDELTTGNFTNPHFKLIAHEPQTHYANTKSLDEKSNSIHLDENVAIYPILILIARLSNPFLWWRYFWNSFIFLLTLGYIVNECTSVGQMIPYYLIQVLCTIIFFKGLTFSGHSTCHVNPFRLNNPEEKLSVICHIW